MHYPYQMLLEKYSRDKTRITRNRLIIISFFNLLTFASAIFSMGFYRWILIKITPTDSSSSLSLMSKPQLSDWLWTNLLYVSLDNSYCTYGSAAGQLCPHDDPSCQQVFMELYFVGGVCFGIFVLAYLIQGYDLYQILRYIIHRAKNKVVKDEKQASLKAKGNYRTMFMIGSYALGMVLHIIGISIINLYDYTYGVGYWIFFATLLIFVIVVVNEHFSMAKMVKQQLILRLIYRENSMRMRQEEEEKSNRESESDFEV